ncbi:hypothetical protein SAMN04487995_3854 [Dyadobacter koreensis]|uniref:Uncharacterized protein n=1 Tax=Dyadobacter koreensis TaxID=408657 RepID=A0A1H6XBX8_9BACT|nr:hypothetical protein [Dyadobacter koreensis]SEJ26638.1 hypothetical protein SAMN04487995_3854 [Dyadobacter koreensis]
MNSQDNAIDRALKEALKRKFDDFETDSGNASEEVIFSKLKRDSRQFAQKKVLLTAGFIIFLVSCYLYFSIIGIKNKPIVSVFTKETGDIPAKIHTTRAKIDSRVTPQASLRNNSSVLQTSAYGTKDKLPDTFKTTKKFTNAERIATKKIARVKIIGSTAKNKRNLPKINEVAEVAMGPLIQTAGRDQNSIGRGKLAPDFSSAPKPFSVDYDNLEIIDKRPMTNNSVSPVKITFNTDTLEKAGILSYKAGKRFSFIINVLPLSPLQMLTVRAIPGITYQNINIPSELSLSQLGYKFTGGIKKGDFAFIFSYGQLKQSFDYEIASEEFELKRTSKDYNFTPVGIPYKQNNKLKFIGLGIKRRGVVKNASVFRGYFGEIGLEFSRELTTKKNLMWSNLAIGKQVIVGKNSLLNIGPYVEYSFTKMVNPETRFQIRPYQVGILIGLTLPDLQND